MQVKVIVHDTYLYNPFSPAFASTRTKGIKFASYFDEQTLLPTYYRMRWC